MMFERNDGDATSIIDNDTLILSISSSAIDENHYFSSLFFLFFFFFFFYFIFLFSFLEGKLRNVENIDARKRVTRLTCLRVSSELFNWHCSID